MLYLFKCQHVSSLNTLFTLLLFYWLVFPHNVRSLCLFKAFFIISATSNFASLISIAPSSTLLLQKTVAILILFCSMVILWILSQLNCCLIIYHQFRNIFQSQNTFIQPFSSLLCYQIWLLIPVFDYAMIQHHQQKYKRQL